MRLAALACVAAVACFGATTQTWEMNGYQDFSRGRINGLSLSRDGNLRLGPKLETLFDSGQPEIWSIAAAPDGSFYLGTGNRGHLYKVDATGKGTLIWTADLPEIFAVAVDSKGVVYAGTSPEGKIYRIENGKATEYFAPGARYIWALALAPDGALFAATGDQGKIFRITASGAGTTGVGTTYYETGQAHVTALAFDAQGRLLAGSEPNGLLYRITAPGKAFVLYDSALPEIRAIVPAADGSIYVAALGGSVSRRADAAASSSNSQSGVSIPTFTTSITVTDQQGGLNAPPKPEATKPAAPSTLPAVSTASTTDSSGVDRSALFKIHPDNTVETLWSSKEENIYDVAMQGASVVFLTDAQGRIYRLESDRKTTLMAQTNEGDATRLMPSPGGLLAATGNLGKLVRLANGEGSTGWYESPAHDSGTVARWGRIAWRGTGNAVQFRTRTGNSARPDATWSDWSNPITDATRAAITSPNARYIQWRAEFSSGSAMLEDVTVAYLPQNTPPVVRSVSVSAQSKTATAAAPAAYSVTVSESADSSTPAGTPAQMISRGAGQQLQVTWLAEDPDGDRMIYNLYFRGEDESQWKLLRGNMPDSSYTLDGDVLADGRYYFRVTASDRPSNPMELAREAEAVSAPVWIDNTPPAVTASAPRRTTSRVEIDADAEDRGSVLRRCEFSVDAGPWSPVEAADGVTDSERERFQIRIDGLPAGEHLVVIRVYDAAGNAGLAKVVVR